MSSPEVVFVLLCEGSTDQGLVTPLQDLLVFHGAGEARGTADYQKGTIQEKLDRILAKDSNPVDLIFVHRDADNAGWQQRCCEIDAASMQHPGHTVIPVVPVTMTEAWLLADIEAIKDVVGRRRALGEFLAAEIPKISQVEKISDPKAKLKALLVKALTSSGRRAQLTENEFAHFRESLLQRIEIDGPVSQLESWQRLVREIEKIVKERHWTQ